MSEHEHAPPLFSIIIPTYNQCAFIKDAVDSALAMNHDNFEVLVADDASTDDTPTVLKKIRDKRLRCIRNETNKGRVANYRNALVQAKGDWVVICDGDDYYTDTDFLSKAAKVIALHPDIVLVGMGDALACANEIVPRPLAKKLQIMDGKKVFLKWSHLAIPHMGAIYPRSSALELDFYRMDILSSDWESLLRLILHGNVAFLPGICGHWRQHGKNASGSIDIDDLVANLQCISSPAAYAKNLNALNANVLKQWELIQIEERLLWFLTASAIAVKSSESGEAIRNNIRYVSELKKKYGIGIAQPGRYWFSWWVYEHFGVTGFRLYYQLKCASKKHLHKLVKALSRLKKCVE